MAVFTVASLKGLEITALLSLLIATAPNVRASSTIVPDSLAVIAVLQDDMALVGAHDIEVQNGLAFVAGKGGALAILDVAAPGEPSLLWSAQDGLAYEDAQTVLPLDRNRLLVGARELLLFDIRQPTNPTLLATAKERPRIDRINGCARYKNTVFAANKNGFIVVTDVTAQDKIRLLGVRAARERDGLVTPHAVALCGDFLIVTDGGRFGRDSKPGQVGVYRVIDAETREPLTPDRWEAPTIIAELRFAGANRVMADGKFAYVGSSLAAESPRNTGLQNNVSVVDLSDPRAPRVRGSLAFPEGRGPNGLALSGRVVFAAGGQTVQAIDVSDPDRPLELAAVTAPMSFTGGADDGHDLVFHDEHLFVTAQNSHAVVVLRVEGTRLLSAARR